jgi:hypothetical protein
MVKPTNGLRWLRASLCSTNTCVEVAWTGERVLVRDTKHPENPPMEFTAAEWAAFLHGARGGEFDFG